MTFKNLILLKIQALEVQQKRYEVKINKLKGYKLYAKHTKGTVRYCYCTETSPQQKYIGWTKDGTLLHQLLERENALAQMRHIQQNLSALQVLLGAYDFDGEQLQGETGMLRDEDSEGTPYYPPSENPFKPEQLRHDTGLGFFTRSKSEALVSLQLHLYGYDFQYEKGLYIRGFFGKWKWIYPDFTVILPGGRVVYIEHVGKMKEKEYQDSFLKRILDYFSNRLLLGRDVFCTMDGPDGEIDLNSVEDLMKMMALLS